MNGDIHVAENEADWRRCFPVMEELRTHQSEASYLESVKLQTAEAGYRIAYACAGEEVAAVGGYRVFSTLAWGRIMYVDDLISALKFRGQGYGSKLIDWLIEEARRLKCDQFHLDSGVHRFVAHRFYLSKGMDISSHHFSMTL